MELWMPGAEHIDGHPDKIGYSWEGDYSPKRGDVKHSAEGWKSHMIWLVQTPLAIKSWTFSVFLDGEFAQHYPYTANCWHAGDTDPDDEVEANIDLVGIEHEGVAGTPLNTAQIATTSRITQWCAEQAGRARDFARFPIQPSDGWVLTEHNQVSNTATACPSNRIPWSLILDRLQPQEGNMFKLYEDKDNGWWLVERDEAFPYSRREIKHQVGRDYLKQRHGDPVKVGAAGEYTEAEFNTIPIIGEVGPHSHTVTLS